jgi:hypothetical protein
VLAHRADWDESTILAVHSFAGERLEARLLLESTVEVVDLLDEGSFVPDADGTVTLPVGPHGYGWFRLRRGGERVAP